MYEFSSKYPAFFSILLVVLAAGFSYLSYLKRDIPFRSKIFLIALRTLAVSLILILFLEPSILSFTKSKGEPVDIVLIDNSRSMQFPTAQNISNSDQMKTYLKTQPGEKTKYFAFSNTLKLDSGADSLGAAGYLSDLSGSLKELRNSLIDDRINTVTIISDGMFNSGESPLGESKLFSCPFVTIGVGDTIQKKDALVENVAFNRKEFIKAPVHVSASVEAYKSKGAQISVVLYREGLKVTERPLTIDKDEYSAQVDFELNESTPGIYRYKVEIPEINGEVTLKNNSRDFLIEYIDNTVKLLFISGGPSYDNSAVENIFRRIGNYKISVFTEKTVSSFYEGNIDASVYNELSAVFLFNFPVSATSGELSGNIASNVKRFNIPVIFFAGKNTDYQKLNTFDESIPFTVSGPGGGENKVSPKLISGSKDVNMQKFEKNLGSLPPLFKNSGRVTQKTGSEVILTDGSGGDPVMINRNTGKLNSTAFLGYGFWKWRLNNSADNEKAIENLIMSSIGMTLNKDKKQHLILDEPKQVYDYMEGAIINAKVWDENYVPTQNAVVKGRLKGLKNKSSKEVTFTSSNNIYSLDAGLLPPDDYTLEADADFNGVTLGKDVIRFIVDTTNAEYMKTRSDFSVLQQISSNSGGKFVNLSENPALKEIMNSVQRTDGDSGSIRQSRFNFYENRYILAFIVLLFSIEWFIKKRRNLP